MLSALEESRGAPRQLPRTEASSFPRTTALSLQTGRRLGAGRRTELLCGDGERTLVFMFVGKPRSGPRRRAWPVASDVSPAPEWSHSAIWNQSR